MSLFSLKVIMVVLYVIAYTISLLLVGTWEKKMNFKMNDVFKGYWLIVLLSLVVGFGFCFLIFRFCTSAIVMWVIDISAIVSLILCGVAKVLIDKLFE